MHGSKQEITKKAKGITLGLLAGIFLFLLAAFVFWRITDEIVIEQGQQFDVYVYRKLAGLHSPFMTNLMLFITIFGSQGFLLPAYSVVAIFFLYKRDWLNALSVVLIGLSGKIILGTVKNFFQRTRPTEQLVPETGYSYPSGHSFSAFLFFGLLIYMLWRSDINLSNIWKWSLSVLFFILACGTAFSRVYLHVHFPSDVIASFCLAVIWLTISLLVVHYVKRKNVRS